ncbi:MAG: hypothetical protein ACJ8FS_16530 [Sphingomicrobium sp.]
MRQSITTKYIGPSNVRGSRIKATARKRSSLGAEMSVTVPYGYGSTEKEHCKAARTLAAKLQWRGLWLGGGNVDENGYVFVNAQTDASLPYALTYMVDAEKENRDWFYIKGV